VESKTEKNEISQEKAFLDQLTAIQVSK
jgi:hypothetical protein